MRGECKALGLVKVVFTVGLRISSLDPSMLEVHQQCGLKMPRKEVENCLADLSEEIKHQSATELH